MAANATGKDLRINIRLTRRQKDVLTRAAQEMDVSLSQFVLARACAEAEAMLQDQARFDLPRRKWQEFVKALDAPVRKNSRLRALLNRPGVFDD